MVERNGNAGIALISDALERLGKARLSVDLAGDLLEQSRRELGRAGDIIAAAAIELRNLIGKGGTTMKLFICLTLLAGTAGAQDPGLRLCGRSDGRDGVGLLYDHQHINPYDNCVHGPGASRHDLERTARRQP